MLVEGLSTKELDRLAGITPGHTWWIESKGADGSKKGIETGTADKLAAALGISLEYLIRGEGPEPTAEEVGAAVEAARARLAESQPASTGTEDS